MLCSVVTDVSRQSISPIFKGQAVSWIASSLKMGPTGCFETAVTTYEPCVTSHKREKLTNYECYTFGCDFYIYAMQTLNTFKKSEIVILKL
jgi:hypothetical protein